MEPHWRLQPQQSVGAMCGTSLPGRPERQTAADRSTCSRVTSKVVRSRRATADTAHPHESASEAKPLPSSWRIETSAGDSPSVLLDARECACPRGARSAPDRLPDADRVVDPRDPYIGADCAPAYADALGGHAEVEVYDDAGHWLWLDRPEVIERVTAFIQRVVER